MMVSLKKRILIGFGILCLLTLIGCSKQEEPDLLPISGEEFTYQVSEETVALAVDEAGMLYTVNSKIPKNGSDVSEEEYRHLEESGHLEQLRWCRQQIVVYDPEGNEVLNQELRFGTGPVQQMILSAGNLYCVAMENLEICVYAVDVSTWEAEMVAALPGLSSVDSMALVGEHLYVLGRMQGNSKTYTLHPEVWMFHYQGEQICRVNLAEENPKLEKMKIDFPIGIYATEWDTLMIYHYTEEKGFGFLEFDAAKLSLTKHTWCHGSAARTQLSGCGTGYVYRSSTGLLYYATTEGVQVQLLPDYVRLLKPVVCQKGFAFWLDAENKGTVRRICIADMIRDNKELRVLTDDSPNDFPFGCGYQMVIQPATEDVFALKVLAGDSDFDLFVLDTRNDCAYNLKKNGAFYALNDVEGVQEYLDACFPYIKELAYNEDGDIWMLPVDVDIPGIVYNKEFLLDQGVDYSAMNFEEFLAFTDQILAKEPDKISLYLPLLLEQMLMQYLSEYTSFDTELFRNSIKGLRELYADYGAGGENSVYGRSLGDGMAAEFYLDFQYNSEWFETLAANAEASQAYGLSGIPKLREKIGEMGTITLLAVNPESENLKETLNYVAEYCEYMLTRQDSFLLLEESMYSMENPFIQEWYRLFAGGEVSFRIEDDVYLEDLVSYLYGEITLDEAIIEAERKLKIYMEE